MRLPPPREGAGRRGPSGGRTSVNATFKTVMLWMSLLVVVFLAWHFAQFQKKENPVKFSEFMAQAEAGQVADVTITGNESKGHPTSRHPTPPGPQTEPQA